MSITRVAGTPAAGSRNSSRTLAGGALTVLVAILGLLGTAPAHADELEHVSFDFGKHEMTNGDDESALILPAVQFPRVASR